jgi:hypothetical protein
MGLFKEIFGNGISNCPECGAMTTAKPGGFTDFYGYALFQDRDACNRALQEYRRLVSDNPGSYICWPAVVTRHVSRAAVLEYRQIWENNHPGNRGSTWKDINDLLDGTAGHDPVVY